MFAKPYKLKSNNTLKNSEKRQLLTRIRNEFPSISEEKAMILVPNKGNATHMKVFTHTLEIIGVYAVDGTAIMIETNGKLLPTMSALWKVPDLIPTLIIHTPVLSKLQGGAPLYLPGVVVPIASSNSRLPRFPMGSPAALCTQDNRAACAVGFTVLSSDSMILMTGGVCFDLVHAVGDYLCKDVKFVQPQRPMLGLATYSPEGDTMEPAFDRLTLLSKSTREEWPSLTFDQSRSTADDAPTSSAADDVPSQGTAADSNLVTLIDVPEINSPDDKRTPIPEDMDGLLRYTFLTFLKYGAKHVDLPLTTNLLYRNYMVPLSPDGKALDIKKSTYKKLSKFLEAMQKEGLVEVSEVSKGVSAVTSLQLAHPLVRAHAPPAPALPPPTTEGGAPHAVVTSKYGVTAAVAPLFTEHKKGAAVSAAEVRGAVRGWAAARGLAQEGGEVALDDTLAKLAQAQPQTTLGWEPLMSSVLSKMTECTEIRLSDGSSRLVRSKLEPIKMQVQTRSGNKKVTLVSNLETFGFSLPTLAQECQRGVAGACGVTRSPGAKGDQLMLQGDQTRFVAKLLVEKYSLPKKLLEGADKALNKKK